MGLVCSIWIHMGQAYEFHAAIICYNDLGCTEWSAFLGGLGDVPLVVYIVVSSARFLLRCCEVPNDVVQL